MGRLQYLNFLHAQKTCAILMSDVIACHAGALVAYLLKNRSLERTSKQLVSIAGVVGVNLVMGGIQETSIDNIGTPF